ncbi:MAG: CoA pyrophosphatase [Deltaproteobacteria bacterium]|nr:CoA pyrophosphatase [Deltaproteobacteria bacterium]
MKKSIARALYESYPGYGGEREFLRQQRSQGRIWGHAGVLLLLTRDPAAETNGHGSGLSLIFTRRSKHVSQPGDLCFPGGHPESAADRVGALLWPLWAGIHSPRTAGRWILGKRGTLREVAYFWAAATRECWEETGVPPWKVGFVGALPCYRMLTRQKMICPMVGSISPKQPLHTSREIDKILKVPLDILLDAERYGECTLAITGNFRKMFNVDSVKVPCFLVPAGGGGEVLWGATYHITLSFLHAVFAFTPPDPGPVRVQSVLYPRQASEPVDKGSGLSQ